MKLPKSYFMQIYWISRRVHKILYNSLIVEIYSIVSCFFPMQVVVVLAYETYICNAINMQNCTEYDCKSKLVIYLNKANIANVLHMDSNVNRIATDNNKRTRRRATECVINRMTRF